MCKISLVTLGYQTYQGYQGLTRLWEVWAELGFLNNQGYPGFTTLDRGNTGKPGIHVLQKTRVTRLQPYVQQNLVKPA